MNLESVMETWQKRVEQALQLYLPPEDTIPKRLHQAMRYSALTSGKRLRPILVYATAEIFPADDSIVDAIACAVELIHAYSLIHDDLPAMDDDDLRRGQATCHKAFDEATAILAGDALQSLAFKILAELPIKSSLPSQTANEMIVLLGEATGSTGMAGGQMIDLSANQQPMTELDLGAMHGMKTGALIQASILLAYLASRSQEKSTNYQILAEFGAEIGLAFQIHDDILDEIASTAVLGKRQGADKALNKLTFPVLLGMDAAQEAAQKHLEKAICALNKLPEEATALQCIAQYIIDRAY